MAIGSRFTRVPAVPSTSSKKLQTVAVSFSGGVKTFPPNDDIGYDELAVAQNVRMDRIGTYRTRRGLTPFTTPIGKAVAISYAPTTGLSEVTVADGEVVKHSFTTTSAFRLWSIGLNVTSVNAAGTLSVIIYESENSTPTLKVAETTISAVEIAARAAGVDAIEARFVNAPDLLADTEYFIVVTPQKGALGAFSLQMSTDLAGTMKSTNGGEFWEDIGASLLYSLHSATAGQVRSIGVGNNAGALTNFFLFNGVLYRASANGAVAVQNDTLPTGVTETNFSQSQLAMRYAHGEGEPRKINLSGFADTEIATGRGGARNLIEHGGYLFYLSDDDPNGTFSSQSQPDIDLFDVEKSFVADIPSPNCGDNLTAVAELGGVLYYFTRRNKYGLYGEDWQNFSVNDAASRNGTFSQASVTWDTNFIYYATDSGIFRFNGTSESSLTEKSIQNVWDGIISKETCKLDIHDNRLYVFYSSSATGECDSCLVYNLNLGLWESFDTNTWVGATCARKHPTGRFLVGSSRVGALFWAEEQTNDYDDAGAPIRAEMATSYAHFGTPAQNKRIVKWRPELETTELHYEVECGFSKDFSSKVEYAFSIDLATGGALWNSGLTWNSGEIWGGNSYGTRMTTKPHVYGEFRRCQLRYRHHAAHEPITFLAHTLSVQTQRLR